VAAVAPINAPMHSQPSKTSWASDAAKFRNQCAPGFSFAYCLNSNMPIMFFKDFRA
jgi:hypothetical protein